MNMIEKFSLLCLFMTVDIMEKLLFLQYFT